MELGDLQRDLAVRLVNHQPAPAGCDSGAFAWSQDSLEAKRRRAAGHLLPRLRNALGISWFPRFREHVERYTPAGMLHHVDDAWAFAEAVERESRDPKLRLAAQDDLVSMRLRYVRDPRQEAHRIRERRGPLLAMLHTPQRAMVVKLPGTPGRLLYVCV
ncbi:MAG TPA: hypothetical protein VN493_31240 [Thermoanaerobaculia bacterium]|nr:hypothetical protein [Thermoanaerobaculia bacterium]